MTIIFIIVKFIYKIVDIDNEINEVFFIKNIQ